MPFPGGGDDVFQFRIFRLPAQLLDGLVRCGHQPGRVAGAARFFHRRNFFAAHLFAHLDDLADGVAVAVAQVVKALLARREGEDVRLREVNGVDVIADAGAVGRGIIRAVNLALDRKSVV